MTQIEVNNTATDYISIHTTRVGGDLTITAESELEEIFQSTPPVWVVTGKTHICTAIVNISIHTTRVGGDVIHRDFYHLKDTISIHTTRVGGDLLLVGCTSKPDDFNPHHPCGW